MAELERIKLNPEHQLLLVCDQVLTSHEPCLVDELLPSIVDLEV